VLLSRLAGQLREPGWLSGVLIYWIPLAVAQACFALVCFAAVQQALRQSANDPQIQLAEDAAARLASGIQAPAVLPPGTVDLRTSLAPFMIVYDRSGDIVAASASLDAGTPALPGGVLSSWKKEQFRPPWSNRADGERRFTWQPVDGVRSAVVVRPYDGSAAGFVLAGRSLREVERREDRLLVLVGLGLACSLAATLTATAVVRILSGVMRSPVQSR
jgi:hypothetical protein